MQLAAKIGLKTTCFSLAICLATTQGTADTYIVGPDTPGTIQALIDLVCEDGDTIQLEPGVYHIQETISIIGLSITIRGSADPKSGTPTSILDGANSHRIVSTAEGNRVFENLVFQHGLSSNGGAVLASNDVFRNCHFLANRSNVGFILDQSGGAIAGTFLEIDGCHFEANHAGLHGGAIRVWDSSVSNSTFTMNTANYDGGGMFATTTSISTCSLSHNSANRTGGGIHGEGCNVDLSTFLHNSAGLEGGGVKMVGTSAIIECLFRDNESEIGGAIKQHDAPTHSLALLRCVADSNVATVEGGGLHLGQTPYCEIGESTICENLPDEISGTWFDLGDNDDCDALECLADFNQDGSVDSTDLGLILALWNSGTADFDLDGNGQIDATDLGLLLGAWGQCP